MRMRLAGAVCVVALTGCGALGTGETSANLEVGGAITVASSTSPERVQLESTAQTSSTRPSSTTSSTEPPTVLTTAPPPSTTTSSPPTTTTTTTEPSFADSFAVVSSGVVRVESVACDGSVSNGSGFLVPGGRVLTAAHVIGEAPVVRVTRDDGTQTRASVSGSDATRDLALLTTETPLTGHVFEIDDAAVRVGDEVAALGHPRGLPLTFTSGRVSNLNFADQGVLFHQTDAPINEGSSGGPLIDQWGRAIGMADWKFTDVDGIAFVVAAPEIHAFLASESAVSVDLELGCPPETPPLDVPQEFAEVGASLASYVDLVNSAREAEAWESYFSPAQQQRRPQEAFAADMSTTFIEEFAVSAVARVDELTVDVVVDYVTLQAPERGPEGQTCSVWSSTYRMVLTDRWRIDRETVHEPSPVACPVEAD